MNNEPRTNYIYIDTRLIYREKDVLAPGFNHHIISSIMVKATYILNFIKTRAQRFMAFIKKLFNLDLSPDLLKYLLKV